MNQTLENDPYEQIKDLQQRLEEAEETIQAIRYDKVDALVVSTANGDQVYTLEGAERPYRIFLEQMSEGAITVTYDGIILYSNKMFSEMLQIPLESVIGSMIFNWVSDSDNQRLISFMASQEENAKDEIMFVRTDNSEVSLYLSKKTLLVDNSETILCIVATDLTEKKRSEEILAAEKLARSILEQAAEAILVCDNNLRIIRASKAAETLASSEVLYQNFDNVFPLYNEQGRLSLKDLVSNSSLHHSEVVLIKKNAEKQNLMINIGVLNGNHEIGGYIINLANITKHIAAEEKLTHSLNEKTVLLKEIHHRVKNNLQIISSLLRLQSMYVKEDSVISILNECQNRITSMALIHQKLYESESFSRINISDYMKELVSFLCSTYNFRSNHINIIMPSEQLSFSIESAVPLGLIINELVTNSFKHGFKGSKDEKIEITLIPENDNSLLITIKDNGKGFPTDIDFYNPETLGLQLVHTLMEQIEGKIELLSPEAGTEIRIMVKIG
jgi:PAS domain S-box-containing protein